jgi:hypothetical protein
MNMALGPWPRGSVRYLGKDKGPSGVIMLSLFSAKSSQPSVLTTKPQELFSSQSQEETVCQMSRVE